MPASHRRAWVAVLAFVLGALALAVPASLLAAGSGAASPSADAQPQASATVPPADPTIADTTTTTTTTTPTTTPTPSTTTTTTTTTTATETQSYAQTTTAEQLTAAPVVKRSSGAAVAIVDGASVSDYGFSPAAVTIAAGDTVTWTNNGTVPAGHNVSGTGFTSPILKTGQSYSHTFSAPGTFSYVCTLHPFMKGTVTVASARTGGTGGSGTTPTTTAPATTTPTSTGISESAAGAGPRAGGTASTLPQTGSDSLGLTFIGVALVGAGYLVRRGRSTP